MLCGSLVDAAVGKTAAPLMRGGGPSGLVYRSSPARTGEPEGSPPEPPKLAYERRSRRLCGLRSCGFRCKEASGRPIPIKLFVLDRRSIAREVKAMAGFSVSVNPESQTGSLGLPLS